MNVPDHAVNELVAAWEQFKAGSSPSDMHRLEMAAGSLYYAVKGTDESFAEDQAMHAWDRE